GRFEPWVKLDPAQTGGTNGLRAEAHKLLIDGWSVRGPAGEEVLGHLTTIDYATGTVGRIGSQPIVRWLRADAEPRAAGDSRPYLPTMRLIRRHRYHIDGFR